MTKTIVLIPAYNEEVAIGSVVLKTRSHVDEVFVVDDGSCDSTAVIAKAAGATVVQHEKNGGYGVALKTCFRVGKESNADIMVILDADGQHNPNDIKKLIEPIQNDKADITIGSRFIGAVKNEVPVYRKIGMKFIDTIVNSDVKDKISDSQSGFRAYSKRAISLIDIKENGMGAGAEILIDAVSKKLRITEVPIKVRYDVGKHSQHPVAHGFSVVSSLIRLFGERHALLSFGTIGIVALLFGFYEGFTVMKIYSIKAELAIGTALISVLLSLIGTYMMFTGIILYVVRDLIERRLNLGTLDNRTEAHQIDDFAKTPVLDNLIYKKPESILSQKHILLPKKELSLRTEQLSKAPKKAITIISNTKEIQ
jgi:glycosyltransferase involved in cell wall biosynthesis